MVAYYGEGCSAEFWSTHKDKWPQGYEPDGKYNEFFQTTYEGSFVLEYPTVVNDNRRLPMSALEPSW